MKESQNDDKVKVIANDIVKKMKIKDPGYFSRFEAVYSGDHLKVDTALKAGGKLMTKVVKEEKLKSSPNIDGAGTVSV